VPGLEECLRQMESDLARAGDDEVHPIGPSLGS
jgi:hypothetical protein